MRWMRIPLSTPTDCPMTRFRLGSMCLNSGDCRTDDGGSNRNLLDFNDLTIDLDGRVYIAFADGCIDACATGNNSQPEDSRAGRGSVYYMSSGPSLYVAKGDLVSPLPPAAESLNASTLPRLSSRAMPHRRPRSPNDG